MTGSVRLCVVDSNVLIDLHIGGLLPDFFRLPLELVAPDVIIGELEEAEGEQLIELGLHKEELSRDQVLEVEELAAEHRGVSPKDLFALVLARSLRAALLSGDRGLRRIARAQGLSVHGTLWVLDELVRLGLIEPPRAAASLELMLASGSRLPEVECRNRLRQWAAR